MVLVKNRADQVRQLFPHISSIYTSLSRLEAPSNRKLARFDVLQSKQNELVSDKAVKSKKRQNKSSRFTVPSNRKSQREPSRSLVQHLLGILLEFTSTIHIANLLGRCSASTVHLIVLWGWLLGIWVNNHASLSEGVLLCCYSITLIVLVIFLIWSLHLWLLSNDIHHGILQSFLVFTKSVLFPCEVHDSSVEVVTSHAILKEASALSVVWLLLEFKRSAVLHELLEFYWVASAKFF